MAGIAQLAVDSMSLHRSPRDYLVEVSPEFNPTFDGTNASLEDSPKKTVVQSIESSDHLDDNTNERISANLRYINRFAAALKESPYLALDDVFTKWKEF